MAEDPGLGLGGGGTTCICTSEEGKEICSSV